jgi:two-component system, CitB family, sensor kinase
VAGRARRQTDGMGVPWTDWSLSRQLLVLQTTVILFVGVLAATAAVLDTRRDATTETGRVVRAVAAAIAVDPLVVRALRAPEPVMRPDSAVQAHAENIRRVVDADFVVVMTTTGLRLSHPTPGEIGRRYIGSTRPALGGATLTETYTGTLGPSVRSVAPVVAEGQVIGLVAVGITVTRIGDRVRSEVLQIVLYAGLALLLATLGALAISRRLRRQTHGLGAVELARLYESWDAVLHSMREGLLVLDPDGCLQLANDEARRLLQLSPSAEGRSVRELGLPDALAHRIAGGAPASDDIHVVGDHTVVVNLQPSLWDGRRIGTVVTLRDQSDLRALGGQVASLQGFADSLRAREHESANQLHTVVTLVELGRTQEAIDFATAQLRTSQQLTDRLTTSISEPVLAALLLGKVAQAAERGVELQISEDTVLSRSPYDPSDLVTVCGNLIDNAVDAAMLTPPPHRVDVTIRPDGRDLLVRVHDTGPGLDEATLELAVQRGWSTKEHGEYGRGLGLALVNQVVQRHRGHMQVWTDGGTTFEVRLRPGPSQ